jgi:hypothetical protein
LKGGQSVKALGEYVGVSSEYRVWKRRRVSKIWN